MANKVSDIILVYSFIKRLTTPFDKTEAFKLGIIDKTGKRIKSKEISTKEEENSYGMFDRLVFNVKRGLETLPFGKSRMASYAAALYLIKESNNLKDNYTEDEIEMSLTEHMESLMKNNTRNLKNILEDVPANSTAGVVGTGDDPSGATSLKKKKKPPVIDRDARKKEMREFIKTYMKNRDKRQEVKKAAYFKKKFGL
jgi:hypothetical protein